MGAYKFRNKFLGNCPSRLVRQWSQDDEATEVVNAHEKVQGSCVKGTRGLWVFQNKGYFNSTLSLCKRQTLRDILFNVELYSGPIILGMGC